MKFKRIALLTLLAITSIGIAMAARQYHEEAWPFDESPPYFDPEDHGPKAAALFAKLGPGEHSLSASFPFQLELHANANWGHSSPYNHFHDIHVKGISLQLSGFSDKMVPGDQPSTVISMKSKEGPGLIDVWAVSETAITPMPMYPSHAAERFFRFDIKSIWIPPDRPVYIRIRFSDATELFALGFDSKGSLRLAPIVCQQGRPARRSLDFSRDGQTSKDTIEFAHIECSQGDTTYQCNPLALSARRGDEHLWTYPLHFAGQAESIRVVADTIYVSTTAGHSFYSKKFNGELLIYAEEVMPGKDPPAEVLELARRAPYNTKSSHPPSLARFIEAAVELEDRRAIPFLIEAIGKGFGLPERAMAVAGLEKFDGHPEYWDNNIPRHSPGMCGVGMKRVYPDAVMRAEQEKWRKVFQVEIEKAQK